MISTDLVKKLRSMTGAPMMDCKNALVASDGDIEAAKDWLRKKGMASALKKSDRAAKEGVVGILCENGHGVILELSSETDFVARSNDFQQLAHDLLHLAFQKNPTSTEEFLSIEDKGEPVREKILAVAGKLGEKIELSRLESLFMKPGQVVGYVHAPLSPSLGGIGVLVGLESSASDLGDLGKKIAMHVAASMPQYVSKDRVPPSEIERERAILIEQAEQEGRPSAIIEKMIDGRLRKFFEEIVLEEQSFIFEPDKKVKDVLKDAEKSLGTTIVVRDIIRFVLGSSS